MSEALTEPDLAGRRVLAFIPYALAAPWLDWVWQHRLGRVALVVENRRWRNLLMFEQTARRLAPP